jgi:hypothetical protein
MGFVAGTAKGAHPSAPAHAAAIPHATASATAATGGAAATTATSGDGSVEEGKGKKGKKAVPPPPIPAAAVEAMLCLRAVISELCSPAGPFECIDSGLCDDDVLNRVMARYHAQKVIHSMGNHSHTTVDL